MRALVDALDYRRVEDRTHVKLTKHWPHTHLSVPALDGSRPERPGGTRR
jgi:hypothetical protein